MRITAVDTFIIDVPQKPPVAKAAMMRGSEADCPRMTRSMLATMRR